MYKTVHISERNHYRLSLVALRRGVSLKSLLDDILKQWKPDKAKNHHNTNRRTRVH